MDPDRYLLQMAIGYLLTIAIETPVLLTALSRRHPVRHRLFAGAWLTACTFPVVWLVLPQVFHPGAQRVAYLAVAETFAPTTECLLFWLAFGKREPRSRGALLRDFAAVVLANLLSFGLGELFNRMVGSEWLAV